MAMVPSEMCCLTSGTNDLSVSKRCLDTSHILSNPSSPQSLCLLANRHRPPHKPYSSQDGQGSSTFMIFLKCFGSVSQMFPTIEKSQSGEMGQTPILPSTCIANVSNPEPHLISEDFPVRSVCISASNGTIPSITPFPIFLIHSEASFVIPGL